MRPYSEVLAKALPKLVVEQGKSLYHLPLPNSKPLFAKRTLQRLQEYGWLSLHQDDPPVWGSGPVARRCKGIQPTGERRASEQMRYATPRTS